MTKPVILPSCELIPSRLAGPVYAPIDSDLPYQTCGLSPSDQICISSPPSIPHLRHNLPPETGKGRFGTCVECEGRFAPVLDPEGFEVCACTTPRSEVDARMRKLEERKQAESSLSASDRDAMKRRDESWGSTVVEPG